MTKYTDFLTEKESDGLKALVLNGVLNKIPYSKSQKDFMSKHESDLPYVDNALDHLCAEYCDACDELLDENDLL